MAEILAARKQVVDFYDQHLDFTRLQKLKIREHTTWNYAYYPVIFETEAHLIEVQQRMNALEIFPRRYFYPSLNKLPYVHHVPMAISESIASRILCLPLYVGLMQSELDTILSCLK